jgi:hypothetical protein
VRTVLDRNSLAFEEGYRAFENQTPKSQNPYGQDQSDLRAAWDDGWNYGQTCGGQCNG